MSGKYTFSELFKSAKSQFEFIFKGNLDKALCHKKDMGKTTEYKFIWGSSFLDNLTVKVDNFNVNKLNVLNKIAGYCKYE